MDPARLGLGLLATHVLITEGAAPSACVVDHFLAVGAHVSSLDISYVPGTDAYADADVKPDSTLGDGRW